MNARATILCPVDFSDASRGALRHARVLAEHFGARLVLLAVEDPLLTEAIDLGTGHVWDPEDTRKELTRFAGNVLGSAQLKATTIEYEVSVGKPAQRILQVARDQGCDLIVMSTHGLTGVRKMFFGSTTERVLRETTIPVLATPPTDEGPLAQKLHLSGIELERKTRAEDALAELLATVPRQLHPEALVAYGDPAEEIAKIARDRRAGLVVIGLHGSPMLGPRMGSVTYRVLCLTPTLVLALPPQQAAAPAPAEGEARGYVHK
jgi:universal stress protein A